MSQSASQAAVANNFTGYSLDYETASAGPPGSTAFAKETDGLLTFVERMSAALKAVGKEFIVDVGGTTAASLSTQGCSRNETSMCAYEKALLKRYTTSGAAALMVMETYYGTDLAFNEVVIGSAVAHGVPPGMLSSGIGSTTSAGCGCGAGQCLLACWACFLCL